MLIIYFILSGLALTVAPWTSFWPKAVALPAWAGVLFSNAIFKGFVSGLGLVLIFTGLLELRARLKD